MTIMAISNIYPWFLLSFNMLLILLLIIQCLSISPGNTKGIRKLATFRNRSPINDSAITKTRKPDRSPSQQQQPQSPKSTNTWKNRMAKQLKKIQQGSGSPVSPVMPAVPPPPGTTIGIPLELCPSVRNKIK